MKNEPTALSEAGSGKTTKTTSAFVQTLKYVRHIFYLISELGELKLIKGTSVLINIYQIQRHPELYENPLEFRPERFEAPLSNPFNWIAFSAGPRNCIGM